MPLACPGDGYVRYYNRRCQCPQDAAGLSGGASRFSLATAAASSNDHSHPRDKSVAFDVQSAPLR
jgi:hypothetical protein